MSDYPEHDKVKALNKANDIVGDFLEWLLHHEGYEICRWDYGIGRFYPVPKPVEHWLAEYFDIDLDLLEKEKQEILAKFTAELY